MLHRWAGEAGFVHLCQLAKAKFYLKIAESAGSVVQGMF